jgi:hypothetical protein
MKLYVTTWGHFEFDEPLELVRRDSLQPGDVAYSSHYGKSVVEQVSSLGNEDQSTHIYWETPNPDHPRHEVYDSANTVPLVSRAAADPLVRLRRWVEEHINQVPDDQWGDGYLAAVKRVQAEIANIDRQAGA